MKEGRRVVLSKRSRKEEGGQLSACDSPPQRNEVRNEGNVLGGGGLILQVVLEDDDDGGGVILEQLEAE